ncbi:MAG: DUF5655 domain-containing protein, partial [Actinomycetota bacterium]|nr:DUF5655 domain-containing protein [Actinomycetota bacterium]
TDESHINRTLQYWDIEKKRFPQYDHVAVIVAERITARFFNVISLFNGYIPIVAIEMRAIEIADLLTLVFTTILEPVRLAFEESEVGEPVDRKYWETKASKAMLEVTDDLLKLVHDVAPEMALNYNKHYIGLAKDGVASNFVMFKPQKTRVLAEFRIALSDKITQYLEDEEMDTIPYDNQFRRYRLRVGQKDLESHEKVLVELVKQAHENVTN